MDIPVSWVDHPLRFRGYTIGARRDDVNTPDRLYVALIASGASEPTTHYAEINPSGPMLQVLEQVMMHHLLSMIANRGQWYIQVDSSEYYLHYTTSKQSLSKPRIYSNYIRPEGTRRS